MVFFSLYQLVSNSCHQESSRVILGSSGRISSFFLSIVFLLRYGRILRVCLDFSCNIQTNL